MSSIVRRTRPSALWVAMSALALASLPLLLALGALRFLVPAPRAVRVRDLRRLRHPGR